MGLELFPEGETLAALALNYGLAESSIRADEAREALELAEKILTDIHGNDSAAHIDVAMAYGRLEQSKYEHRAANRHFRRAIGLAETHLDDALLLANIHLEIGELMLSHSNPDTDDHTTAAMELYRELGGQVGVEGEVRAARSLGNYYLLNNQNLKGREVLTDALELAETHNTDRYTRQSIHAVLAQHYELKSMHEEATTHVLALGKFKRDAGDTSMLPLLELRPKYPPNALRRGQEGWVQLRFTVDEMGMVVNPEMIDNDGAQEFVPASVEAIKGFRFAPRFDGDTAVSTDNVHYIFRFYLDD